MNYNIFTSHWSETYAKHLFDIYNTRDWTGRPHTCRIVWTGRGLETRDLWVVWLHSILPYTTSPTARTGQVENCTPDSLLLSDEGTGRGIWSIIIPSAEIWYSEDRNCFVLVSLFRAERREFARSQTRSHLPPHLLYSLYAVHEAVTEMYTCVHSTDRRCMETDNLGNCPEWSHLLLTVQLKSLAILKLSSPCESLTPDTVTFTMTAFWRAAGLK